MISWIKKSKLEFIILLAILFLAAFLRFYRLPEYMTFLGDEGRDAIVVKDILVNHHFPLLGPVTSIGNMYLGPLYYYMMAVSMAIFWLNPVAAAAMDGVIGLLTIFLIYYLGRAWFGKWPGLIASFLYSISPITIFYSRSSWNPNPAPFFALLSVLGMYRARKSRNFYWLILAGVSVAAAVQMHYLALILVPIFGLLWFYEIVLMKRNKLTSKNFVSGTILAIIGFLLVMSPIAIFDLRHNFMNFHAIMAFFSDRQTTVNVNPLNSLDRMPPIYLHSLIGRYLAGDMLWSNWLVGLLVLLPLLVAVYRKYKGEEFRWVYLALGTWLVVGIGGLSLYKQTIYDHYLGFLNPVPYLLLGSLVYIIPLSHKWNQLMLRMLIGATILLVVMLAVINLQGNPLLVPPNMQLQRTQAISKFIIQQSGDQPFNFALLSAHNYDSAYQFYLDIYGHKPKQVPFDITSQLFVVCEDPVCEPLNNPKYEIAGFGMSKVESEQAVLGVKVFKLVPNPTGKP